MVSPPASGHWNLREARRKPLRKRSSQRPVSFCGRARLKRKQRGAPPIAATSLIVLARHFQPTESGGCLSRRKCVFSRNQSQVRMVSCPDLAWKSAVSSPIPKATDRAEVLSSSNRHPLAILLIRESSSWRCAGIGFRGLRFHFVDVSIAPELTCAFATLGCAAGLGLEICHPHGENLYLRTGGQVSTDWPSNSKIQG